MPKYMIQARYDLDGARGVVKQGATARRAAAQALVESLGGKLEAFYFAFGDVDVFAIADMPDHVTAATAAMAVNTSGGVSARTVALLSAEDMDKAAKRIPAYRGPAQ